MVKKQTATKTTSAKPKKTPAKPKKAPVKKPDDKAFVYNLISSIVEQCPRRQPTSPDEKRAQLMMQEEFRKLKLPTSWHEFTFNDNLYKNIALHFGLATLGTVVSGLAPAAGLALHGLAAGSYTAESTRKGYFLRRVFPFKPSQNLMATMAAPSGNPKLRIVMMAHADAAFTGLLFSEEFVKNFSKEPPKALSFIKRSMEVTTKSVGGLAGFDALRMAFGPLTWPLRPLEYLMTLPSFIAFVLNMEIVLRNEIVPGANDDLSGVASLPVLARRLKDSQPDDVEYVFAVTGCEEASLGGADALARDMEGVWDKENTVILGLDGLTNGDLVFLNPEGEIIPTPVPGWLCDAVDTVARSEKRFEHVKAFEIPVGGSDVAAFLVRDYEGLCLATIDPEIGAPKHYHQPGDTPENLDMDTLMESIDFAEALVKEIQRKRG